MIALKKLAEKHLRRAVVVRGVVFISLLLSTLATAFFFKSYFDVKAQDNFDHLSEEIAFRIEKKTLLCESLIRGARGFFNASDNVSRGEFETYFGGLNLSRFSGVLNLRFLKRVLAEEQQAFVEKTRSEAKDKADPFASYSIHPEKHQEEYMPLLYIEPFEDAHDLLGYDLSQVPERWRAMQTARDLGTIYVTDLFTTTIPGGKRPAVAFFGAIYQKGMPKETVEDRRKNLSGFVALTVDLPSMLEDVAFLIQDQNILVEIFNADKMSPAHLLYSNASDVDLTKRHKKERFHKEKVIHVARRPWLIHIDAPNSFGKTALAVWAPLVLLLGGALFSYMFANLVYLLMMQKLLAEKRAQELFENFRVAELQKIHAVEQARALKDFNAALEKKVAERTATLEASHHQLLFQQHALNAAFNGIVISDVNGNVIWANEAISQLTGFSAEELKGQNPRVLKSGKQDQTFYKNLWGTITAGKVWRGELVNKRKDGSFYTERMTITPIRNQDGNILNYVAVKEDVTAQKNLEDQLRQSQKMEVVGQLAGGVAHDFNNLLTVINGYSEILEKRFAQDEKVHAQILAIKQAGQRAAVLTGQLLAMGRRSLASVKFFDLNQTIKDSHKILERLLPANISLDFSFNSEIGLIRGDENQVNQVILNLVVNARDAMPDGGKIKIQTNLASVNHANAEFHGRAQLGDYVLLSVADTGCGMTDEVKKRMFEPFFTTKEKGKGTGLGLSTCYGIMRQHEGFLRVESEVGKGTTFFVYFPIVETHKEGTRESSAPNPLVALRGGEENILVVEDESGVRGLIATSLQAQGYQVAEAENGEVAKKMLGQNKRYDLILSDVMMPVMGGKKLYEYVAENLPKTKFIFMSGYASDDSFRREINSKQLPFIQKPFQAQDLLLKIRQVLDAGKKT